MAITVGDTKSNLYVIVKNARNDEVEQVVHLQNTKIGTSSVSKNLEVTGNTTLRGISTIVSGSFTDAKFTSISGSLQRLTTGDTYLAAGNGIRVVSGSTGQIVVTTSKDEIFSLARIASARGAVSNSGNFTVGIQFMPTRDVTCSGIRFYWATANKTVKVTLWTNAGSNLANTSVSVESAGVYEGTFTTAQSLTAGTLYKASAYQTDTSNYTGAAPNSGSMPARPLYAGGYLTYTIINTFSAGDAVPTSLASTEIYFVEPIFTV